ncbi:MAG: hypothetical protein K0U93_31180 [Gammaproteobacteria bacterium]|nr:hypothetical protein [Gammaproteobacteria bacterium]
MKQWIILVVLACCAQGALGGVGFSRLTVPDPMGGQMQVSLWYPSQAPNTDVQLGPFRFEATRDAPIAPGRHKLVIVSHGTAGSDLGHRNIALELASRGVIAAAPLHPRDNYRDQSGVGKHIVMAGRPKQLGALIDSLLAHRRWGAAIDADRIGAFGFSLGGYSVLGLVGATASETDMRAHCRQTPADPFCEIVGAAVTTRISNRTSWHNRADRRVCAIALADPVAAPFSTAGIASVSVTHARVWRPEFSNVLLGSAHGGRVVAALNSRPERQQVEEVVVPGAQHYSFLAPFPDAIRRRLPAALTADATSFDRRVFQKAFAKEASAFLDSSLDRCPLP